MDNVTYIFPILKFDANKVSDAWRSIQNVTNEERDSVIVVGNKETLKEFSDLNLTEKASSFPVEIIFVESEETSVYALVNEAVMQCTTEYFSVLEPGESYKSGWPKNANLYGKGSSVIIPLVNNLPADSSMESFLSNELAWSASFNDENNLGVLSMDFLDKFMDVSLSGAYFNTEDFISIGKFKPSLKIVTWYEYLLRCAYKSKRVYVVPKIGVTRQYAETGEEISSGEADWLIKTARQEYFFNEDREKKFEEE